MPKYEIHLAIADKIYFLLGNDIIKNPALFFCGNLAPDAYESGNNNGIFNKKHTHMCDDEVVHSYGYGYPKVAEQFRYRINEFIKNYYMKSGKDKDLYLGYIVHLLTDEIYRINVYQLLEKYLKNGEINSNEIDFRKNLADKVAKDEYKDIFNELSGMFKISINDYPFEQNLFEIFDRTWDCEIKDFINFNEINAFNNSVLCSLKNEWKQEKIYKSNKSIEFVDIVAKEIIDRIFYKYGIF